MTIFTPEERSTKDRGESDRARARVDFVSLKSRGIDVKPLVRVLPREPILLDEVSITPSKRWQNQETTRQAKQVLAQAKQGRPVSERDVVKLQQRLLSMEHQDELAGRPSEGRQLAVEFGELRRSKLVEEALDALAKAKKGRRVSDDRVAKLQQRLLGMQRQDELSGGESEGQRLALELAEVRRSKLVAEASDVLERGKEGRRFPERYVTKLQQRLLGMERQDELTGRASEGQQLSDALGEMRRSKLVAEALDVLAQAKKGRHFPESYVIKLQKLLVAMQREDELSGLASEGVQLATDLASLRR